VAIKDQLLGGNMSFKFAKPTLKVNWADGVGEVGNLEAWRKHDPVSRADFLKDWIYELEKEYQSALNEAFPKKLKAVK
jgi:hypothetical protein